MKQKVTPYKLDRSLDLKNTKPDSFVDAMNVNVFDSLSDLSDGTGDLGVIKNINSNSKTGSVNDFDLLDRTKKYMVLGSTTDYKTDIVYFFVWCDQLKDHGIYAYDPNGFLPKNKTVGYDEEIEPNRIRLIYKSKILTFDKDAFVKGDIVHTNSSEFAKYPIIQDRLKSLGVWEDFETDPILYFTDNKNEPKKINLYRALLENKAQDNSTPSEEGYQNYSYTVDEPDFISACPKTPIRRIKTSFINDPSQKGSNFENIEGMQFAYQWVYKDGIESAMSVYSEVTVPVVRLTQGAFTNVDHSANNVCRLFIPCGSREVEKIRLYVRDGDRSNFLFIDEIDRAGGNQVLQQYDFKNDIVLTGVSSELVSKQFDAVPLRAQAQTVAYDRLWYANYVSGFDNVNASADITPIYDSNDESNIGNINVRSAILTAPVGSGVTDLDEYLEINGKYNGGGSLIIDTSEIEQLVNGQTVSFQVTMSPDKNFHLFRRHGWLPSKHSVLDMQDDVSVVDNNIFLYSDNEPQGIVGCDYIYFDGQQTTSQADSKIGCYAGSPLIIQGGDLTFSIEFTYTGGTLSGNAARSFLSLNIARALSGEELPNTIELSQSIVTPSINVNLGLQNFEQIKVSNPNITGINSFEDIDERSFLICSVPENDHETDRGYIGYYIINKCKAQFKMQLVRHEGSYSQVLLTPSKITEIEAFSCIRRPNNNYWWVIDQDFLGPNPNANKFEQFKENVQEGDDLNISEFFEVYQEVFQNSLPSEFEVSNFSYFPGFYNYKKQFGYAKLPETISFEDVPFDVTTAQLNNNGVFLMDGEAGIGGSNGPSEWQSAQMYRMGSVPLYIDFINSDDTVSSSFSGGWPGTYINYNYTDARFIAFGQFFTGGYSLYGISPEYLYKSQEIVQPNGQVTSVIISFEVPQAYEPVFMGIGTKLLNSFPLMNGRVQLPYTGLPNIYTTLAYDVEEDHPEIEISVSYASVSNNNLNAFKSFKSSSMHDFGVVYYDERGRHGFVNELGSVYVKGYSDIEREQKGRVSMRIKMQSEPPSWAKKWKIVHSRSTSIDKFIQYSSGGAYLPANIQDDSDENIYVSLNYLQGNSISYANSFGARSPEGSPLLYTFKPGDKVRVISYEDSSGNRKYDVNNCVFDIADMKILGDDENPLNPGSSIPETRHKGYFLVLKNNSLANGFSYSDVLSAGNNNKWSQNAIIEIYTPSKNNNEKIYYEIGDDYDVNFEDQFNAHGPVITIGEGDVWWRRVAVNLRDSDGFEDLILNDTSDGPAGSSSNFKNVVLESETSTDLVKADSVGLGRPNAALDESAEVRNESSVTYSEATSKSGYRNRYSSFNNSLLNFKDIDSSYGAIRYIINKDGFIMCITKNRVVKLPVYRNIISTSGGGSNIVSSPDVVSDPIVFDAACGCDNNPESVVDSGEYVFFTNKSMGRVFRVSNSGKVEEISDAGMKSFFIDAFSFHKENNETQFEKIVGGYDPPNDEYILSINSYSRETAEIDDNGVVYGCTDADACNYNENATVNDGSCTYPTACYGCDGELIDNDGNGTCDTEEIFGCTDPEAINHDEDATSNDGSCIYQGCTDPNADNYDPNATVDNETCIYPSGSPGCLDSEILIDGFCTDATIELFIQAFGLTVGNFIALKMYGVDMSYFFPFDVDEQSGWVGTTALNDIMVAYGLTNEYGYSAVATTYIVEPSNEAIQPIINDLVDSYLYDVPYNEYTNIIHYLARFEISHRKLRDAIPPLSNRILDAYMPPLRFQDGYEDYNEIGSYQIITNYRSFISGFVAQYGQSTVSLIDFSLDNLPVIPQS